MGCNCGGARRSAGSTTRAAQSPAADRPRRGPGSPKYYWEGAAKRAKQDEGSK